MAFGGIVVWRASSVGVYILDIHRLQPSHLQSILHGQIGTLTVFRRCRLVESITTISITGHVCKAIRCIPLKHNERGSLTEIKPGTRAIKRATTFMIKYH